MNPHRRAHPARRNEEDSMKRMIIALLLMTLGVAGCVVDGGYYGRGYGGYHGNGGWNDRGEGYRPRHPGQ
jgi:hypothetical protein